MSANRARPPEEDVTLEAILKVNQDRRELLDKAKDLEAKLSTLTDRAEKKSLSTKIKTVYDSVSTVRNLEYDLLRQADHSVVVAYKITVEDAYLHPLYNAIAASQPSTSTQSQDTAHLSVPTQPTGEVDTSPLSGFEIFSPSFKKNTPSNTKKNKSKKDNSELDTTIELEESGDEDIGTSQETNQDIDTNPKMPDPPSVVAYSPPTFNVIYNGSSSVKKFFAKFEAYAATFKWDEDMRLAQLLFYLDGAAMKCYENLKRTKKPKGTFTYDTVKAEMEKYFASKSSPQEYDKKLRERKLMFNENMEQYFWDVLDLVYKVDKNATFDKQRDHVLKGLPQETAKDIWNSKPDSLDSLHDLILTRQKFESLMGKKAYDNSEQAINEVVNQLENLGFKVEKPPTKQEVTFASNKKKKFKGRKGNAKPNSQGHPSAQSSRSQSHPRGNFRNNNNRRGNKPFQNHPNNRYQGNFNSWGNNQKGRFEENPRRGQFPNNRGFGRQGPPRYNNYQRYPPRDNYVNTYDHYGPEYYNHHHQYLEAVDGMSAPAALPYHTQAVNTFQGNGFL